MDSVLGHQSEETTTSSYQPEEPDFAETTTVSDLDDDDETTTEGHHQMSRRMHKPNQLKYYNFNLVNESISILDEAKMVHGWPLKMLIHGFNSAMAKDIHTVLKNQRFNLVLSELANLDNDNFTVVILDWMYSATPAISAAEYPTSASNTWHVGQEVAAYLGKLKDKGIIGNYKDVHLVGHSLGAHVAGVIGHNVIKQKRGKIGRITGLDPAGPIFDQIFWAKHYDDVKSLDKEDAEFVDVIHTCQGKITSGYLGSRVESGHVDFYPNGGSVQPQCKKMEVFFGYCSHEYSVIYYAMAIRQPEILIACPCDSYKTFRDGKCKCDKKRGIPMGHQTPRNSKGLYFMTITNTRVKFATGSGNGIVNENVKGRLFSRSPEAWTPDHIQPVRESYMDWIRNSTIHDDDDD